MITYLIYISQTIYYSDQIWQKYSYPNNRVIKRLMMSPWIQCKLIYQLIYFQMRRSKSHEDLRRGSLLTEQNQLVRSHVSTQSEGQFEITPLERLISKVGGENTYQFCSFIIFSLLWFFTAWILVGQAFFFDNSFTCTDQKDPKLCKEFICSLPAPKRPNYIKEHANSIVFAFDNNWLICQNDYYRPILTSLTYFGSLLGFFILPYLADNWGRKPAIKLSWSIYALGILCLCICDSPNMVGMGFLFAGMGCNPAVTICYSFINQQCLGNKRQYYSVGIQVFLAIGQCVIGLLFLPGYSWRYVFYLLFVCILIVLLMMNYLVESPKFLISKSKKKTLQVLNTIAKRNNKKQLNIQEVQAIQVIQQSSQSTSVIDLFKYRSLRWISIGGGMVFLAIQVIYYGTSLNLDKAGYSMLINQQIIGISEALGYIGSEFIISKVRRKKTSALGMGLSVVFCLALGVLTMMETQKNKDLLLLIETIGLIINRFILCGFWVLFFVFISQLYPTRVRSMGLGWVSAVGTIGSTMSSYIIFFSQKLGINSWFPPALIGCLGLISIFCLRQTFGKPMKDEIKEVEESAAGKISIKDDLMAPLNPKKQ